MIFYVPMVRIDIRPISGRIHPDADGYQVGYIYAKLSEACLLRSVILSRITFCR